MAYGNVLGYEDGPVPGSAAFTMKDGRKLVFGGQQAEDLKRKLDQSNALGPQPTAQFKLNAAPALVGGPAPAPQQAADFQAPTPGAGGFDAAGAARELVGAAPPTAQTAPTAPAAPAARADTQQAPAQGGGSDLGLGLRMGDDGRIYEYRAGSAGSKGGLIERSRTERGGFDPNQEYLDAKTKVAEERQGQLGDLRQLQADNFEAEQALLQDQRVMQADAQAEEQARLQSIDQGVKHAEQARADAVKDYVANKNYDPMKRALSGGKNWIYGLSAGLGAVGSALLKSPNYALEVVNGLIDKDVAAQEKEIEVKRDAADNALADLERRLGSRDRAKATLASIQSQLFQNSLAQQASREQDVERRTNLEKMMLDLRDQDLDRNEKYRLDAAGEVTKNIVNAPSVAASAGGWAPVKDQLGTASKLTGLKQDEKTLATPPKGEGAAADLDASTVDSVMGDARTVTFANKVQAQLPTESTFDPGGITRYLPFVGPDKKAADQLNADTAQLASSIQTSKKMGSSDDDASRAEGFATGTGSLDDRRRQAKAAGDEAARNIAIRLKSMTPAQQQKAWAALPPDVQAAVKAQAQR